MFDILIPFLDSMALIQGLTLGIIIILVGKRKLPALLFGLFVITYSLELGDSILHDLGYNDDKYAFLYVLPFNFYFLNLPLLYLYVLSITGLLDMKKHFWFLLPGILEFAFFTTMALFILTGHSLSLVEIYNFYEPFSIIFYILFSVFIIYKVNLIQGILNNIHSSSVDSNLRWVIWICMFLLFYVLCFAFVDNQYRSAFFILLNVANVLFIYLLGVLGIRQKYVGIKEVEYIPQDVGLNNDPLYHSLVTKDNDQSPLIEEKPLEPSELFLKIEEYINLNQSYLDQDLNLILLARQLRVPSRSLSENIKIATGKNFKKYINGLRIEHAKVLLVDPFYEEYTMDAIGGESGFQSKSTFYAAFNEEVKLTPTEYKASFKK